ncbi:MAG: hypothetical protein AB1810_12895 [Pseudomonadota bacterium]
MKTTAIIATAILFGLTSVAVIASPNERNESGEYSSEHHGKKKTEESGEYKKGHEAKEGSEYRSEEYREGSDSDSEEYSEGGEYREGRSDGDRR